MSVEILSTGWYSNDGDYTWKTSGDDSIRSVAFRELWWYSIENFISPEKVFIVDSNSPVLPDDKKYTDIPIEWLRLSINPGHAQNTQYHYCGWMASVILGLEYALLNGIEYFLYVEQDALVYGKKFIEQIEKKLIKNKYVFGSGTGTPQPLQQSIFAIRKDAMREFLSHLHSINQGDNKLSPEIKFELASKNSLFYYLMKFFYEKNIFEQHKEMITYKLLMKNKSYDVLPFGYGRTRPINFNDNCFYFQHASIDEIEQYKNLVGF